jgi:DNA-binding transcriptional LysR family regulator
LSAELAIRIIDNTVTNPESKIPKALANFHKMAPDVDIKTDVGGINELESKTINGTLVLSMGFFPARVTPLEYELLFTEEHTLYCGDQHPLFSIPEPELSLDDILDADYVSRGPSENSKYLVPKFPLHAAAESPNMEGALLLLLSGRFIGYLPNHYAKNWEDRGELRSLMPARTSQSGQFHLIPRKGVPMPKIAKAFIGELQSAHAI